LGLFDEEQKVQVSDTTGAGKDLELINKEIFIKIKSVIPVYKPHQNAS
jgi:hypothetical protein